MPPGFTLHRRSGPGWECWGWSYRHRDGSVEHSRGFGTPELAEEDAQTWARWGLAKRREAREAVTFQVDIRRTTLLDLLDFVETT